MPTSNVQEAKDIHPELLSQKFLKFGEYHHYDDWKQMMQATYDQFNLLELKPNLDVKINYDHADKNRNVPKGIFPRPDHKREVMIAPGEQRPQKSLASDFAKYDKDPHNFMIQSELELSKKLKDISDEVGLITNLQNMKYSLLSDYADE